MQAPIREKQFTLAADGDATGYLNVTANAGAYPGAVGWLTKADRSLQQKLLVTDLSGTDKIGVRFLQDTVFDPKVRAGTVVPGSYGRSDCSSFPSGSFVCFASQLVEIEQPTFVARGAANL